MTSVLNVDTIADKAGTGPVGLTKQTTVKSFTTFAGDGTAIRDSFNVASLVDDGSGISSHNFTNSMSNTHYTSSAAASYINDTNNYETYLGINYNNNLSSTRTTSQNHIGFWESAFADPNNDACCSVIGDLA